MPTTADYLNDLVAQKNALAANLNTKGVSASQSETLNTLVPKVLRISGEGGGDSGSYDEGYADGKQAQYDEFWDTYQENGNRYNYNNAFSYWPFKLYKPKYPFKTKYCTGMFAQSSITDTIQPIIFRSDAYGGSNLFQGCSSLVTIQPITVTSDITFSGWFSGCGKLTNITFTQDSQIGNNIDFGNCPLSKNSILNIISVLVDYSGTGLNRTLTLNANNLYSMGEETLLEISTKTSQKGWSVATL